MRATRSAIFATSILMLVLHGCSVTPPETSPAVVQPVPAAAPARKPVGELTLNLPEQGAAVCPCTADAPAQGVDRTFLDKGFTALVAGDHEAAVNYFRRYQRLESSPGVDWEAGIAIAYNKMLPDSPYYNWRAAREDYLQLVREKPKGIQVHEQIKLMQDALLVLSDLHTQINDLQKENDVLSESLEKREEALRRLRELTLGQKEAAP